MKNFERVDRFDKQDEVGRLTYMCESGGFVMAKRPRQRPIVLTIKEWAKLERWVKPAIADGLPE